VLVVLGFRVWGLGFRNQGSEFRVRGVGCRVRGLGFRYRTQRWAKIVTNSNMVTNFFQLIAQTVADHLCDR
jgi:hypothetical protein